MTSASRMLNAVLAAAGAKVLHRYSPLLVGWAVTNRCNSRCAYCDRPAAAADELSASRALDLADAMAHHGVAMVTLSGGEPLLRPDIGILMRHLRSAGVLVGLNTNGALLPDRIDEAIAAHFVTVSIDGPEEVHDRIRGTGSFRAATKGIGKAVAAGLNVRVHATLTRHNVGIPDFFLSFASEQRVSLSVSPVDSFPLTSNDVAGLLPPVDAYRSFLDRLIIAKRQEKNCITSSMPTLLYLRKWPDHRPVTCSAGRIFCRIEPDGFMHACGAKVGLDEPVDATAGFGEAFSRLHATPCRSCWSDSEVEMNLLYSLDPRAIREAAMTVIGTIRSSRIETHGQRRRT